MSDLGYQAWKCVKNLLEPQFFDISQLDFDMENRLPVIGY